MAVRAGFAGVLQVVPVEVGQQVAPGTNLARVADPSRLKAELKITDAQAPQWNRFAEALRGTGKSMEDMHRQMMQSAATATLPARLARQEQMLSAHLVSLKTLKETLETLYASFSDDQKKIADGITIGPMGMM